MKKIFMILAMFCVTGLTACSTQTASIPENSEQPTTEQISTNTVETATYDKNDNSLEALISRANITPSGYLISHYGNSQCHIMLGNKNGEIIVTMNEDQITLERLIDCTIGPDNMCSSCGKLYSSDELEYLTKAELITQYIEANTPKEEEVFGIVNGYIPYAVDNAYMYEFDLSHATIENNLIHTTFYDLEISVLTDTCKTLEEYLPNETNLSELNETESYKYVNQYLDEELTQLSAVYIIKDLESGCVIHKFTNINVVITDDNTVEDALIAEVALYDNAINESEIDLKTFYKSVADKNKEDFILEDLYQTITLNKSFIPDYNKQFIDVDCNIAYIDTTDESNKVVIISNYTEVDLETELFTKIEDIESEYSIYESNGFYYFRSEIANTESSVNTIFGFSGFENVEEALEFYTSILKH